MTAKTDLAFDVIARDKATNTFDKVADGADNLGSKLGDFAKRGAAAVAAFALAGAAAVAAIAAAGVQFSLDKSKSDALLAGQLGVSPEQAKELGKATGKLYAGSFAESVAAASDAVRATITNKLIDPNAGAAAITAMAARTASLAALMVEDFDRVSSGISQLLRTGMVKTAEEAFDLLTVATQRGVNKSQDLLDTVNEYSTQFRQLGIDGPMAIGLLSQAIQAGARDSDTAADALKEFAIRAIDASTTSAQGYKLLGLDAKKMTAQIALGGQAAAAGLDIVLSRLRDMKDPVAQNAAAVALFGTKAEDLGKSLFAMAPATAKKQLGEVSGAMDDFIKSQESAGTRVEGIWRGTLVALDEKLGPAINKILDKLEEWGNDPELQAWLEGLRTEVDKIVTDVMPMLEDSFTFFMDSFKDNKEEFALIVKAMVLGLGLILVSILQIGGALGYLAGFGVESFRTMVAFALSSIGVFIGAAEAAFSWIPGLGPKLTQAKAEFGAFAKGVNDALAGIKDKDIRLTIKGINDKGEQMNVRLERRAFGGPVVKGRPYVVGDAGRPELFVPDQSGMILPQVPTAAGGSPAGFSAEPNVLEFRGDGSRLADLIIEIIRHAVRVRGRGNVQLAFGR